jgi:prepilin-type N-terminal cleavage/methylation domain-containing protein
VEFIKNIKTNGFTLIEVITAVAIMAIVGATFSSVSHTALKISTSNRRSLQSIVIAENYLEEIRAARDNNPNNLKSRDSLKSWLNAPKDWLSSEENSLQFQNDVSDSQAIVKNSDTAKGVLYVIKISCFLVEQDLYQFTVEVSQPNTNLCVLSTRLFIQ